MTAVASLNTAAIGQAWVMLTYDWLEICARQPSCHRPENSDLGGCDGNPGVYIASVGMGGNT